MISHNGPQSAKMLRRREEQKKWVDEVADNLRKDEKLRKKKALTGAGECNIENEPQKNEHLEDDKKPFIPKVTNLLFYRQYNTYQALIEAYPQNGMSDNECFSKIILYIMKWFKNRIGDEGLTTVPEVSFLNSDYPNPEEYKAFDISNIRDINSLSVIDLKTAYMEKKNAWMFQLVEPDNGNEKRNIHGRVFSTNICVYKMDKTIIFGVRTSCKEPVTNTEDADVYRPGFIRTIFMDPDIELSEAGVPYEYRFKSEPTILNGKSAYDCNEMYERLISNPYRQFPILFIPEELYFSDIEEKNEKKRIDDKTVSFLGFCHVVVWTKSNQKLFGQTMNNQEFVEVSAENQLIIYRSNPGNSIEVEPSYYEFDDEDKYTEIDRVIKKTDPLRRTYDFREFDLVADQWNAEKVLKLITHGEIDESEELKLINYEMDQLRTQIKDLGRDNEQLQKKNDELDRENKQLEKKYYKAEADVSRNQQTIHDLQEENKKLKGQSNKSKADRLLYEKMMSGINDAAKEKFLPLIHFPRFEKGAKEEILFWIEEYYSDVLIIHDDAKKAFLKDNRNINWRIFCMMIHYLAGYTHYRNDGGMAIDSTAARDYDPDGYGFTCEPTSSGSGGAANMYTSEYTIDVSKYDETEINVIMDMHMKKGKGWGDDMIRIYFYYDSHIKKSIIGYMPDHLRTRNS